jgi:antitoxin YefM
MAIVSQSEFRANMAKLLDQVEDDSKELIVTRTGGKKHMVILSIDEFESWKETEYLLSSAANAASLRQSLAEADAGKLTTFSLEELSTWVNKEQDKAA